MSQKSFFEIKPCQIESVQNLKTSRNLNSGELKQSIKSVATESLIKVQNQYGYVVPQKEKIEDGLNFTKLVKLRQITEKVSKVLKSQISQEIDEEQGLSVNKQESQKDGNQTQISSYGLTMSQLEIRQENFEKHLRGNMIRMLQEQIKIHSQQNQNDDEIEKANQKREESLNLIKKKAKSFNRRVIKTLQKVKAEELLKYDNIMKNRAASTENNQREDLNSYMKEQMLQKIKLNSSNYENKRQLYNQRIQKHKQEEYQKILVELQGLEEKTLQCEKNLETERSQLQQFICPKIYKQNRSRYREQGLRYQEKKEQANQRSVQQQQESLYLYLTNTSHKNEQLSQSQKEKEHEKRNRLKENKAKLRKISRQKKEAENVYLLRIKNIQDKIHEKELRADILRSSRSIKYRSSQRHELKKQSSPEEDILQNLSSSSANQNNYISLREKILTQQEKRQRKIDNLMNTRLQLRRMQEEFQQDIVGFFVSKDKNYLEQKLKQYQLDQIPQIRDYFLPKDPPIRQNLDNY